MGLFWKRKKADQFVTLGLNEPVAKREEPVVAQELPKPEAPVEVLPPAPELVPPVAGAGPAPIPVETKPEPKIPPAAVRDVRPDQAREKPVPSRSPFATSVLGLNLSMEELQAQEAALEQEFSARFRRAVSATRESLSDRLDTVFQNLKQIDENLLDELEEALIAADIGVATTQHILETVRRGVARKQINDLDALKL